MAILNLERQSNPSEASKAVLGGGQNYLSHCYSMAWGSL